MDCGVTLPPPVPVPLDGVGEGTGDLPPLVPVPLGGVGIMRTPPYPIPTMDISTTSRNAEAEEASHH